MTNAIEVKFKSRNGNNSNSNVIENPKASLTRMIVFGIIVIIPSLSPGMSLGYSAVVLPQLDLDIDQASWFASIASVATPIGNLAVGCIIDRYGRKPAFFTSIVPCIIGWFLLATDFDLTRAYCGRLLTGFALGAGSLAPALYAAECIANSDVNMRTPLTTWLSVGLNTGLLTVYFLGKVLSYKGVAFVGGCLSVFSFVMILLFIPESPAWLYSKGRIGDAEWSEKQLGISQPILNCSTKNKSMDENAFSEYFKKIARRDVYTPLAITVLFLFFLQFSGIYVLNAYMVDIINTPSFDHIFDAYTLTVVSGIIQVAGIVSISFLLRYIGVKKLTAISCFGTALGMLLLGCSSTNAGENGNSYIVDSIHIIAVWLSVLASSFGFLVFPFSYLGEVFPVDASGFASISLIASSIFNFIVIKTHLYLRANLMFSVFYIHAAICLIGTIFVWLFLPETVGKSCAEIKNHFMTKKYSRLSLSGN